jgi:hypothetical protein
VDTNLGWKGPEKYVATVPQIFDLWQDPQERYDIFMNNYTERTWTMVPIGQELTELMKTYVKYPPRKLQSMGIRRADRDLQVPEVPVRARDVAEGRHQHSAADGHGARRNANVDQRVLQQLYDWDLLPIGEITIAQQDH